MDRRTFISGIAGGVLAVPVHTLAQQQGKVWHIGFLSSESASEFASRVEALRSGLRDLGYVEGKNIVIEYRWAEGDYTRLPGLAAGLVSKNVDVLVTHGTPVTLVAKHATTTIPIVATVVGDAVASGIVSNLARPGGNITGVTYFQPELSAKRLELLKVVMPSIGQVAMLVNPRNPIIGPVIQKMEIAARSLAVGLQVFEARAPAEIERAFSAMLTKRIDAVVILDDTMFVANDKVIAQLAEKQRLLSISQAEFADAGGLMGYGVNILQLFRRAAYFVDKILTGTKPGDVPVEQPTEFELAVNMKTAKALGIKFPNSILLRADKLIE